MALLPIGHFEKVRALAVSGRTLAVGGVRAGGSSVLSFYDYLADKPERAIELPAHVLSLAADDDGFVAACSDGALRFFSGSQTREVKAHAVAVAVRGDLLVAACSDGALRTFSRKTGAPKKEYALSSRPLRAAAIEPAGGAIAGAGDDGVVRVVWLDDERRRDMPGHDGPVLCLAFTPEDGRIVSGGDDGTVRIWYLSGEIEADVRGKDDSGHVNGTTAILFAPATKPEETGERFFTAGADGKVRLWRASERRKPRTFEPRGGEAIWALAFGPLRRAGTIGRVYCAGDARTVFGYPFDAEGQPQDARLDYGNGFDLLAAALAAPARTQREQAVKELAALAEPEALELALRALSSDREAAVRALAASELAAHGRRDARKALRGRLDDDAPKVRAAVFAALCALESDAPVSALRAAIDSKYADVRADAVRALPPLFAISPLVLGLIAGRLADGDAEVRRVAVEALVSLYPAEPATPLRLAFERGAPDVRVEALVRGALAKLGEASPFAPIVGKALDDEDADVRKIAFVVSALARPPLLAWLEANDEGVKRTLDEVVQRAARALGFETGAPEIDPDVSKVKGLTAQFAQFAHPKHGEIAIFKPTLHTPIKPGDEVHLVGLALDSRRAKDYVVGSVQRPASADLGELRGRLAPRLPPESTVAEEDREPLLAALACRTADTALRGAYGLALLGDMRALGALLTISRDAVPLHRRAAAGALAALNDPRAKRRLAWMMSDPDAAVRDAALLCYARLEPDPIAVAAIALQSAHEDMRVRGLDRLVKEGKGNARAEQILGDALEDESAKVRAEAFRTLWSWHTATPFEPLDRALSARFPDLRLRAVQELEELAKKGAAAAAERVAKAIADRDPGVARAAYAATLERKGKADADTHLAAIASTRPEVRALGAKDAVRGPFDKLRSPLTKLLEDADAGVRIAAIEALDELSENDRGALYVGLQSSHLDLRVRAAELLAARRDEQIVSSMQALIADKDLLARSPSLLAPLRVRASMALASLGAPKLLRYFATELIKDDDPLVREQAARGVSNASRRGEEGFLLDLLGHAELAVRSWAAEGLARLGDARALPVLTGTLKHDHPPIRIGAILSFAALGPEGYGGMLQGLEDPSRDVQRIVLSVILARDLKAFRAGEAPELLASALSSARPEVRFAAARALELRAAPERYLAHLVEVLMPDRPERAEDAEKWPDEAASARLMTALADAIAGDRPEQRYAAAQTLRLRDRPLEYFREAARTVRLRASSSPYVPETTPRAPAPATEQKKSPVAFLRRLFASGPDAAAESPEPALPKLADAEERRLALLAFGAYVGLLRAATAEEESHRVRRDAIERVVEITGRGVVRVTSSAPALARALDDPNHLVRRAAFGALRAIYTNDAETPLSLALASSASDVVRAALDDLAARGPQARPRIVAALDSNVAEARRYAFELLEKSAPPGSPEPLLAALGSAHADLRIGVLERLATSQDPRVVAALGKALESDHEDLRLRAAELLAARKDDRAVDVLAAALRADDPTRALDALARIGSPVAIAALSARLEDLTGAERVPFVVALGKTRGEAALDALARRFDDEESSVRAAALDAAYAVIGPRSDVEARPGAPIPRAPDQTLALRFGEAAAKSRYPDVRLAAAKRLDDVPDPMADALLVGLFGDRSGEVRAQAALAYAERVEKKGAPSEPLDELVRGGARETMLAAALGLAAKGAVQALRPLLLFVRAGEGGERERALFGLGALGDKRALAELEVISAGGTEEAPAEESMQAAAIEALGRLYAKLDDDAKERVRDRIDANVGVDSVARAVAAVRGARWIADGRARSTIETQLAKGTHDEERRAAAKALGEIPDAASEGALAKALGDDDAEVRFAARAALAKTFPSERTRIELAAVESEHDDIAGPAAAFLAAEGDASELLAKLAKIRDVGLRTRLRYGLARRERIPAADLAKTMASGSASVRADAAWVAGMRASALADGGALGEALAEAAAKADAARREAHRRGKTDEQEAEAEVVVRALWAARRAGATELHPIAQKLLADRQAPPAIRAEAARALGTKLDVPVLSAALTDPDLLVRAEAASALARASVAPRAAAQTPLDPVTLGRVAQPGAIPALNEPIDRLVYTPIALGTGELAALVAVARRGAGRGRLDAIGALGLSPSDAAISALASLCAKDSGESEDVRKAAYRALRRAKRVRAREVRA
jgi:ParB family transcriptional regulator, chromosome partitioning protein